MEEKIQVEKEEKVEEDIIGRLSRDGKVNIL